MFHAIIWREKWARFHGQAPCRSGHLTVLQWRHGFVSCLFSYLKILLLDLTSSPPPSHSTSRPARNSTPRTTDQPCEFTLPYSLGCTMPNLCTSIPGPTPSLVSPTRSVPSFPVWTGMYILQATVSTCLHPIHAISNFEDQPNPHILCSFPVCFVHIRPELTKVHMCRSHHRNAHSVKVLPSPQIHQS